MLAGSRIHRSRSVKIHFSFLSLLLWFPFLSIVSTASNDGWDFDSVLRDIFIYFTTANNSRLMNRSLKETRDRTRKLKETGAIKNFLDRTIRVVGVFFFFLPARKIMQKRFFLSFGLWERKNVPTGSTRFFVCSFSRQIVSVSGFFCVSVPFFFCLTTRCGRSGC